jgi:hypothetical protein
LLSARFSAHHAVLGEVVETHLSRPPLGRPDTSILEMKDLGENVFYGRAPERF